MNKDLQKFIESMDSEYKYVVSVNAKGEPTMFAILGKNDMVNPISFSEDKEDDVKQVVHDCIESIASGTMVMNLVMTDDKIRLVDTGKVGFIIYGKPVISVSESLNELLEGAKLAMLADPEVSFALRYKRRLNKWYLHMGAYSANPTKQFDKFKVYDCEKRSHISKGGDE